MKIIIKMLSALKIFGCVPLIVFRNKNTCTQKFCYKSLLPWVLVLEHYLKLYIYGHWNILFQANL